MKRAFMVLAICLAMACVCFAQQNPADAPATKEDIERYFDVMHTREMAKNMMDLMRKQMRQMVQGQVKKEPNLPSDFEDRMNKMTDDMMKSLPIEDLLQAMIPAYEHNLTKGDIDALIAFYSSPAGQKYLKQLPAIQAEGMQAAMGIAQKWAAKVTDRVQEEIAQAQKGTGPDSSKKPQPN
ncbi:MAG TPA: DUF2059 domain-containing protein [Candidatus Limnocylindrales bacterium]|nr:DUF2059 domain-containing protein [Candidatus Limnocylindrales bacterium]